MVLRSLLNSRTVRTMLCHLHLQTMPQRNQIFVQFKSLQDLSRVYWDRRFLILVSDKHDSSTCWSFFALQHCTNCMCTQHGVTTLTYIYIYKWLRIKLKACACFLFFSNAPPSPLLPISWVWAKWTNTMKTGISILKAPKFASRRSGCEASNQPKEKKNTHTTGFPPWNPAKKCPSVLCVRHT